MAKWLSRVFVAITIVSLIAATTGYYFTARSLPKYDVSDAITHAQHETTIARDAYGIPHIQGKIDTDAFFGLGFAHAQDRLWQMVESRRTVQGRLSKIYGSETLPLDRFMRTLNLWHIAQRSMATIPTDIRLRLDAYADGVNAYIAEINRQKLGSGAPEFMLFERKIVPWSAVDSVALLKMHAFQSTAAAEYEIEAGELLALLGPDTAREFGPSSRLLSPRRGTEQLARLSPTGYGRSAPRSFAMTADTTRTADEAPILGVASTSTLSAPSGWHLAHMTWQNGLTEQSIIGATIPGIPIIFNGHNNSLAWGVLPSTIDDQDIVILKTQSSSEGQLWDGSTTTIHSDSVAIPLHDDEQAPFTRQWSVFGPIIPVDEKAPWALSALVPEGHAAALSWTGFDDQDNSIGALMALMDAKSVEDARQALTGLVVPTSNVMLADSNGSTATYLVGARPERDTKNMTKGASPTPSWLMPAGYVDTTTAPAPVARDIRGLAVDTHQSIGENAGQVGADQFRFVRAQQLMAERPFHTVSSFAEAQNDVVAADARTISPILAGDLLYRPDENERRSKVLTLFGEWTGEFDALDPEPLIYMAWVRALNELIFFDELGANYSRFSQVDSVRLERVLSNADGMSKWCDIITTSEIETCAHLIDLALDKTLDDLSQNYGSAIENWRWGRVHQVQNVNPAFELRPFLSYFSDIPHQYSGGDETLSEATSRDIAGFDFNVDRALGFKMIVDFADINRSKYVIATGQSGHLLSIHYDDQSVLWRDGEYIDMTTDKTSIEANTQGVIRINRSEN